MLCNLMLTRSSCFLRTGFVIIRSWSFSAVFSFTFPRRCFFFRRYKRNKKMSEKHFDGKFHLAKQSRFHFSAEQVPFVGSCMKRKRIAHLFQAPPEKILSSALLEACRSLIKVLSFFPRTEKKLMKYMNELVTFSSCSLQLVHSFSPLLLLQRFHKSCWH